MTLYTKQIIINPISDWTISFDYSFGNKVVNNTAGGLEYFQCILNHTSDNINEPGEVGSWPTFWVQIFPTDPNVDISNFVETVLDTEIGSGEVRSCSLRINADRGSFITDTNDGETPIIDQFTQMSVFLDDQNGLPFFAVYEVDILHPKQDGIQGTVLPVDLLGTEFYLQKTLFADQFFFKSMFNVSSGIVNFYNQNRGAQEASIKGHDADSASGGFNDLPVWTANDYTFNLKEMTHYDGLIHVMDRGGSSVAAGGAGDFFEIGFTTNAGNFDQLNFRAFSSGNPTDQNSIPNIKSDDIVVNPAEQEGEIDATVGNVVGTWTDSAIGTLPYQNANFIGGLEAWRLFPEHVSGAAYPQDAIILVLNTTDSQGDHFHYKANKDTTNAPPTPPTASNADWDQYQFIDFLQNEVNYNLASYSFWTDIKSESWESNNAKTNGSLQDDTPTDATQKVWDSNQVKIDGTRRQTWVDVRATDPLAIPTPFIRNGGVYRGFRVLVDGTGTGDFTGFDDNVIQWDGNQWLIFFVPEVLNLVCVDEESRTYQFDDPTWSDVTTTIGQSNDVYHSVFDIFNTQGHNDKSNGIPGGNGATATATNILGFITDVTADTVGSNYTVATTTRLEGGNPILTGRVQAVISGGQIVSYNIISAGFGYQSDPTVVNTDNGGNFGQTSAVTYEFQYLKGDNNTVIIGSTGPSFYRQFAGVCFRAPFPFNSYNGNTIGLNYGNSDERLPATFEAENMGLTSSGLSGFNNSDAEDLGPFSALTFFIKHEWRYQKDGSGSLVLAANYAYRCALYDIDDTVVTQDFVIPYNNLWESISLPISGFNTYKARAAWAWGNAIQNIFLQKLEILNSFRWRNIKKISIHWLGPYDDQGRYQPWGQKDFLFPSVIDTLAGLTTDGYNIKVSIDSFQWAKPGLSLSPPNTQRPLQPEFYSEPLITNKYQNDQANLAKLEITKFRHKEFEVTTVGQNDLRYGDSFFLENPKLVNDSDRTTADLDAWISGVDYIINNDVQNGGVGYRCRQNHTSSGANEPPSAQFWTVLQNPIPNTIKLVAKKIVRAIDKRPDGPGGFLRTITGVRRFVEGEE